MSNKCYTFILVLEWVLVNGNVCYLRFFCDDMVS